MVLTQRYTTTLLKLMLQVLYMLYYIYIYMIEF